ncbi:hypothetical protein C5E05_19400 [Pseudoclavibacter sp. AY1H1]|nr:hypothetical protein C5E05_19400 [Pseudoclavibacter sp. AY1H1]
MSIYGAIAIAHSGGLDLTDSTFRSYASKGRAPRAVTHVGRQPFWNPDEIWPWAKPADKRRDSEPDRPGPLELEALHLLAEPPEDELGQAYAALLQLPTIVDKLEAGTASHKEKYLRSARASMDPPIDSFTPASLARWFFASRRARQTREVTAEHLALTRLAQQEESTARSDLSRARAWLPKAAAWAEWAQQDLDLRADHVAFDRWLDSYAKQFQPPAHAFISVKEWCSQDPARVAYLHSDHSYGEPPTAWKRLDTTQQNLIAEDRIELAGADFGYRWRIPGQPLEHRLSWHESTGELYLCEALRRNGSKVLPLTQLPAGTTLRQVMDWLLPFEQMIGHPSAFGLLSLELEVQRSTNWRSLSPLNDAEPPFPSMTTTSEQ